MTTFDVFLPTVEELTVEEINLSTPSMKAGAVHLGKYCEKPSKEFVLCKREERDMRKCINEGKVVTACGLDFFRKIKSTCLQEFVQYADCLDKSSVNLDYQYCKKTQGVFDKCVLEQLDMPRPHYAYFCRPKIHETTRPKPPGYLTPDFPDSPKPIEFPPDSEIPLARHGSRFFYYP